MRAVLTREDADIKRPGNKVERKSPFKDGKDKYGGMALEVGKMKVVIIGGVATGPKAAARLRRLNSEAEITIIERGKILSYAGCGMPSPQPH